MAAALLLFAAALLISPAVSDTCTSQTFPNRTFSDCSDLPALNASLHWTYNASALTLSVAFTAAPARPNGWISYALNPTGSGMIGSQALVAFAAANGSLVVQTYNISSFAIRESPILYGVVHKSAVHSGQQTTIFATLRLPEAATTLNHTWQVGPAVANGVPVKHDMGPENMASTGVLTLAGDAADAPAGSPSAGPSQVAVPPRPSGGAMAWGCGLGLYGVLVLLSVSNIFL